ncbi:MAG: ABC transporter ATP-binding protein [Nocardioidaceae bacterium]|nr:ABC transporter ATP-binding protein [Nocardioidaceae bacterium]
MTDRGAARVVVRGLGKDFGDLRAVHDVDLTLRSGTVTGLVGPNGAGKSTTIGALVALVRPTRGTVVIDSHDVVRDGARALAGVGYLPSVFVGRAASTARRYLDDLARLRRLSLTTTIGTLAERLRLDLDQPIGHMSHGTRQKVGVVQAFMHEPTVLLLDEPTTGLDPLVQDQLWQMVDERRDAGAAVLLSSHVMSEVQRAADDVAMMSDGLIVLADSMLELTRRRSTRLELRVLSPPLLPVLRGIPGVRHASVSGHQVEVDMTGPTSELFTVLAPHGIESVTCHDDDLAAVFADLCGTPTEREKP